MKLTRRKFRQILLSEITKLRQEAKQGFYSAIMQSNFWTLPHSIDDVDLVTDTEFSTPAIEKLMDVLNDEALKQGSELYFILDVTDFDQYALGPGDKFGGYPNNWMMRGMYQGPQSGKHVVYLGFRPLADSFRMEDLDPAELVGKISRTINHELVHYTQLKKQATTKGISDEEAWEQLLKDKKQIAQSDKRDDYLGLHNEIDAYAHEAAEELLDTYGIEKSLDLLRYRKLNLTPVVKEYIYYLKGDKRKLNRFLSKVHTYLLDMTRD
jgi:hypothetical protein